MTAAWLQRPEGGGRLALRLLRVFALWFGRGPARLLLYPVALYFLLRRGPERRASRAYLGRATGRPGTTAAVYRHFLVFAQVTLDRIFLLKGGLKRFDFEISGLDELDAAIAMGRGVLMFSAHFGSFEALRALNQLREDAPLRVVIDLEQNPAVSRLLNSLNPQLAATIINARQPGPAVALAIKEALDRGALVAMLADRARPGNRVLDADFLGAMAPFPTGAWELAAALKAPVVLCFGAYLGSNRYRLAFELLAEKILREREGGKPLGHWIKLFAGRLAARAREAPYNWFNFYDFWAR